MVCLLGQFLQQLLQHESILYPSEVTLLAKIRSSYQRCSIKNGVVMGPATLLKKRLWHRCLLVIFAKYLRINFYRTPLGSCFWKTSCWRTFNKTTRPFHSLLFGIYIVTRNTLQVGWKMIFSYRIVPGFRSALGIIS